MRKIDNSVESSGLQIGRQKHSSWSTKLSISFISHESKDTEKICVSNKNLIKSKANAASNFNESNHRETSKRSEKKHD